MENPHKHTLGVPMACHGGLTCIASKVALATLKFLAPFLCCHGAKKCFGCSKIHYPQGRGKKWWWWWCTTQFHNQLQCSSFSTGGHRLACSAASNVTTTVTAMYDCKTPRSSMNVSASPFFHPAVDLLAYYWPGLEAMQSIGGKYKLHMFHYATMLPLHTPHKSPSLF